METINNTSNRILLTLLKEPFTIHTATSLAKALNMTRQGLWKTLNNLAKSNLIELKSLGGKRTSLNQIKLNQNNSFTLKFMSLLLTQEALSQERWKANFAEIEKHSNFIILFGSILNNPKEANDIDILVVLKNKSKFKILEEIITKIQKTQLKKIHLIDLTENELKNELKEQSKAYIDALKKGIIIYGQDNYLNFIGELR